MGSLVAGGRGAVGAAMMTEHANVQRFPLQWPVGWKRTQPRQRRAAAFRRGRERLSVWDAIRRLSGECERLGASEEIISTNVATRLDGLPRSDQSQPSDPGAALYVTLDRKPMCFACDKWDRVADNIAAIAQHIDALRRIDRYGVGKMERAFAGYLALPISTEEWHVVLGLSPYATLADVDEAFTKLTCLVGEAVKGIRGRYDPTLWCAINWPGQIRDGSGFNDGLLGALENNDFDFVEDRLDAIEDRALELKRQGAA